MQWHKRIVIGQIGIKQDQTARVEGLLQSQAAGTRMTIHLSSPTCAPCNRIHLTGDYTRAISASHGLQPWDRDFSTTESIVGDEPWLDIDNTTGTFDEQSSETHIGQYAQ